MPTKKEPRIAIGIPVPQMIDPDFAIGNLQEIVQYTALNVTKHISIKYQVGIRTDANRNIMLRDFLEEGFDYLLWLDADMLYPQNIIEQYLMAPAITGKPIDVIGCLYFKRDYPYSPIAYKFTKEDRIRPFTEIPHLAVQKNSLYDVDGLGFGGLMVAKHVYDKLKNQKWHVYGRNFHLPFDAEDKLTHDLVFCKRVRDRGMNILLHGSVRPFHIGKLLVDGSMNEQKIDINRWPRTLVLIPATKLDQANEAAEVMKTKAGMPCDVLVIEDKERKGFVKTINSAFHTHTEYENYVYTAQDAYVGRDWLLEATASMARKNAGLVAFNDAKWRGRMAQFGLVNREWALQTFGNIFPDCYVGNYCDVEISQVAKQQDRFAWSEKGIMLEVDPDKDLGKKQVIKEDKLTYALRKKTGFDGKVIDKKLLEEFS